MIAVLRYQLLDIRLVVSRFALYLLLSGLVIAGYLGLVTLLDRALAGSRTADGVRGGRAAAGRDLQSRTGLAAAPHRPAVLRLAAGSGTGGGRSRQLASESMLLAAPAWKAR